MSPDKPAQPQEGKPDDAAKAGQDAAEAKQTEAKAAGKEKAPAKAAKGEPKAKAEKPKAEKAKAAKDGAKAKAGKRAPAKKAAAEEQPQAAERAPARGRRDSQAPRGGTRRVVKARARYVRTSARKARMVCGHIRGKSVQEARAILAFTPRDVARDWKKLLESAIANAESNHELLEDDLVVREAYADECPTIKRFRPRAMGRATPIRKRTSHLTIALAARPEPPKNKKAG